MYPQAYPQPQEDPNGLPLWCDHMTSLMALALACDATRVSTFFIRHGGGGQHAGQQPRRAARPVGGREKRHGCLQDFSSAFRREAELQRNCETAGAGRTINNLSAPD